MTDLDDHPPWMISRGNESYHYSFFIYHVSEDNDDALQLKQAIGEVSRRRRRDPGRGIRLDCFLDEHDWRFGFPNTQVIRDHLLASEHMIVWVTPNYLRAIRGWVWVELALAELIQLRHTLDSYRVHAPPYPFIYPVFLDLEISNIERTPLLSYWQQRVPFPRGSGRAIREIARCLVEQYWRLREATPPGSS